MKRILDGTAQALRGLLDLSMAIFAATALVGACVVLFADAYDPTRLWLGAPGLPAAARAGLLLGFGATYFASRAARGGTRPMMRRLASASAGAIGILCLLDALAVARLEREGSVIVGAPLSLSLIVVLVFAVWLVLNGRQAAEPDAAGTKPRPAHAWGRRLALLGGAGCMGAAWIGLHLSTFGASDYRRPADAIVVLGAAVREDGTPSDALRDRVATACALYREGLAPTVVMSGGHTPGRPLSEPTCMRDLALELGVPGHAIVLDEEGWNTEGTIHAIQHLVRERGWQRVLFVSHDYHLARIKLRAERHGVQAVTVPAKETVVWRAKPLAFAREVVAFGWNVVRP